jgi:hypothetical protein
MGQYMARLRYYVGDALEEIRQQDLDRIGKAIGAEISFERIDNRTSGPGIREEETMGKPIEEITQDVITVDCDDEASFRKAVEAIYETYRSPRTPYSFWGSSKDGARIAKGIADKTGGGW